LTPVVHADLSSCKFSERGHLQVIGCICLFILGQLCLGLLAAFVPVDETFHYSNIDIFNSRMSNLLLSPFCECYFWEHHFAKYKIDLREKKSANEFL